MVTTDAATGAAVDSEVDLVGQWTTRLMDAMCCVTKGFSAPLAPELVDLFSSTMDGALMCVVLLPTHEQTRLKVCVNAYEMCALLSGRLLHRAIVYVCCRCYPC
jgi:hypothetical protein